MSNVNFRGIKVFSKSRPDFVSSRRHFMYAASAVGGFVLGKVLAPSKAVAQPGSPKGGPRRGGGGAHCFLRGTRILTLQGERSIEDLRIGDLVSTISGDPKPVKWIGRMRVDREALRDAARAPVKIARGAFNGVLPNSDLYVSYRHSLLINGLLIPAGDLINGNSITRVELKSLDSLEYFHIELERHDVIFANGAPAETLEGSANRADFDNFDEYVALYGDTLTTQIPCAPIVARNNFRQALTSHLRGALAPIYDRRQPLEIIQDELARQADHRSLA
jgi:hypothetical protein